MRLVWFLALLAIAIPGTVTARLSSAGPPAEIPDAVSRSWLVGLLRRPCDSPHAVGAP
jgi:hypothetical protein